MEVTMKKRVVVTGKDKVDIVRAYESELISMIDLAERYGITRQGIYKILKHAGIDTTKRKLPVTCTACGQEVMAHKARIRRQKWIFCNHECYAAWLQAGNGFPYIQNRNGQLIARSVVSKYFVLREGHVVHHENRNNLDNRLENLRVFANQGDHIRYHRGFDSTPIWDGSAQ
jgi:hypothetical protein